MRTIRLGVCRWALVACALLVGCESGKPPPRARQADRLIVKNSPSIIRDTIGAQATLQGTQPTLVTGYGLVVGLNNTGGGDVPGPVRAVMEREMLALGVGKEAGPFRGMSPNDIMNDKRTAVVLVSAAIPAGAPKGTRFDVRVDVLPGTSTTSLDGGRLYTTRLYRGLVRPAAPATEALAEARGELFLNPFADPAKTGTDSALRTAGRVLNGGVLLVAQQILLAADSPSHTRVRASAEAINSRFPRERGAEPYARGMNEELIELQIPESYREDPDEFLNLVRRVRVDRTFPEEAAVRYVRALREQPELSEELAWCLEALGPVAIPHVRSLYDSAEIRPRLAAVTAGAKLGDLTTRPHLEELVTDGPPGMRLPALRMLGRLPADPKINVFLRDLLDTSELDVRIVAYEALERRRDPSIERHRLGDAFIVDLVPSAEPMVYVTMQKQPKIVLFGENLELRRPVFASVWDDRLMVSAQETDRKWSVFYRDYREGDSSTAEITPKMLDLIEYFAHKTTPEQPAPGLSFSYSEVVGALAAMLSKGVSSASFVPETDRLELELIRLRQSEIGIERPELVADIAAGNANMPEGFGDESEAPASTAEVEPSSDRPEIEPTSAAAAVEEDRPAVAGPAGAASGSPGVKKKYVVPLPQSPSKKKSEDDGMPR